VDTILNGNGTYRFANLSIRNKIIESVKNLCLRQHLRDHPKAEEGGLFKDFKSIPRPDELIP
jgi:hypothetical protein